MKKWILSVLTFLLVLPLTLAAGFFLAVLLAGPHSDILPDFLHVPGVLLIFLTVLAVPLGAAYGVFHGFSAEKFD